ncbi:uncharacterized protein LOC119404883 [Rhipicephalus sanguineus]|uniref:Uncharacterized protein n=1 Tax=Rhipicephalus sanguineus TaxID=34632 RepID=A0A9D4SNM1_RHISA|nr:uncharacterized protein LOC119404883 [Rhipicephalus sanguineus]KAH7936002.1 hypothetical protein HPB52_016373 [Rhipicephalus sanguineus]
MAPVQTRHVQRAPHSTSPIDVHCHNMTRLLLSLTANLSSSSSSPSANVSRGPEDDLWSANGSSTSGTGSPAIDDRESEASQRQALLYIVVVLFFYSFGIGFMMIRYMRQEAKEQEECKMYRRYINAAHEQYLNATNRARLANRLALQALNTVNAIPQTTHVGSKVTFV